MQPLEASHSFKRLMGSRCLQGQPVVHLLLFIVQEDTGQSPLLLPTAAVSEATPAWVPPQPLPLVAWNSALWVVLANWTKIRSSSFTHQMKDSRKMILGTDLQAGLKVGYLLSFYFFKYFFAYGSAGSSLPCAGFLQCIHVASQCRGFSDCRAQTLGVRASVTAAHGPR